MLAYDNAGNESAFSKPATFTVVPAGAQLKLLTQPTSVVAFAHFGLTVQVEDDQGNVFSDYEGNVTVSLANNPSDLEGTLTETAVNGVATFSGLTLPESASGDKIQVTASGLTTVTTGTITVTPSAATKLEVTEQPPSKVDLGGLFSVTVTAENASGSPVNNFFGTVTVALANNPGGATLGGTLTVTAADGVASFPILRLNRADTGYTLSFTGSGLTSTTTRAFTVTPPETLTGPPTISETDVSEVGEYEINADLLGDIAIGPDGDPWFVSEYGGATSSTISTRRLTPALRLCLFRMLLAVIPRLFRGRNRTRRERLVRG